MTGTENAAGKSSDDKWFVAMGDDGIIEVALGELTSALRLGRVSSTALVWRLGMDAWVPLNQVPLLNLIVAAQEPEQQKLPDDDATRIWSHSPLAELDAEPNDAEPNNVTVPPSGDQSSLILPARPVNSRLRLLPPPPTFRIGGGASRPSIAPSASEWPSAPSRPDPVVVPVRESTSIPALGRPTSGFFPSNGERESALPPLPQPPLPAKPTSIEVSARPLPAKPTTIEVSAPPLPAKPTPIEVSAPPLPAKPTAIEVSAPPRAVESPMRRPASASSSALRTVVTAVAVLAAVGGIVAGARFFMGHNSRAPLAVSPQIDGQHERAVSPRPSYVSGQSPSAIDAKVSSSTPAATENHAAELALAHTAEPTKPKATVQAKRRRVQAKPVAKKSPSSPANETEPGETSEAPTAPNVEQDDTLRSSTPSANPTETEQPKTPTVADPATGT